MCHAAHNHAFLTMNTAAATPSAAPAATPPENAALAAAPAPDAG